MLASSRDIATRHVTAIEGNMDRSRSPDDLGILVPLQFVWEDCDSRSTSSSGQDVALWPRQPRFDSWCGHFCLLPKIVEHVYLCLHFESDAKHCALFNWPCGLMDKALVFGTKDCRFESCQGHFSSVCHWGVIAGCERSSKKVPRPGIEPGTFRSSV